MPTPSKKGLSYVDRYRGYKWIPIPREKPINVKGISYVTEAHHVAETKFLIQVIRELAVKLDGSISLPVHEIYMKHRVPPPSQPFRPRPDAT